MNGNILSNIIWEDKDILVCQKEAGLAVQTNKSTQADMVSLLRNYRKQKKEEPYIGVIHRIDQPVEGLIVFAKNQKAAEILSKQIREKVVDKQYYAVLSGRLEKEEGTLIDYLKKDAKSNLSSVVNKDDKEGKKAILSYQKIAETSDKTLIKVKLETGRHHQIRVQFSNLGYPLFGDEKYNAPKQDGYLPLGLCSYRIGFIHPTTKKEMVYEIIPQGRAFAEFSDVLNPKA